MYAVILVNLHIRLNLRQQSVISSNDHTNIGSESDALMNKIVRNYTETQSILFDYSTETKIYS
jgi:hypothetical protein